MVRSVSLFFAVIIMTSAALAQNQNPQENTVEDRACRADARRFCKDDIPDQFKIGSCLQINKEKLSRSCKEMLASHGMI
jgi:hypothetical protein